MKNKYKLVAAFCAAFLMTPVYAQELVIYVYADRTPSSVASTTYSYESVEVEDLEEVSSLDILTSGPKGQMSSLYIRGADSDQSLVTLNGISIKDQSSPTGTDDLGQHNFTGISLVEVYKGPMSSLYGANAAGGVVNLISDVTGRSYAGVTIGSNNLLAGETQLSGKVKDIDYSFTIGKEISDGISVYPDGQEDDPYDNENVNLNLLYSNDYESVRLNYINETNFTNLDSMRDTLNYTGNWNWKNTQLDYNNETSRLVLNNSNHKRVYTKDNLVEGDYNSTVNTLYGSHLINLNNTDVMFGGELEEIDAKFFTNIRGMYPYTSNVNKERTSKGVFVNTNTVLLNSTVLSSGIRYDTVDGFGDRTTGRLGISKNGARASVSTGYRIPTLYEMYGQDNYGFTGNPNLLEESTTSYEVGYKTNYSDTAVFVTKEDDAIIYNGTYINDDDTSYTKGIENKIFFELDGFFIANSVSYIEAKQSNGNEKLRRPKLTNNLKVSKLVNDIVYSVDADYYGKHKDISSTTFQTIDVSSIITYNTEVKYNKNNLELFAGIYNISNKKYERPNGYSQLGRNFKLGFRKYF